MEHSEGSWAHALAGELAPYGIEESIVQEIADDIESAPPHSFQIGDRVQSELSSRTGVVQAFTAAIVLIAYDDRDTNVDYAEAPDAWVPHAVLKRIGNPHVLYEPSDFNGRELDFRNPLAIAVCEGGLGVCKKCGAAEADLDEYLTCEAFRAREVPS